MSCSAWSVNQHLRTWYSILLGIGWLLVLALGTPVVIVSAQLTCDPDEVLVERLGALCLPIHQLGQGMKAVSPQISKGCSASGGGGGSSSAHDSIQSAVLPREEMSQGRLFEDSAGVNAREHAEPELEVNAQATHHVDSQVNLNPLKFSLSSSVILEPFYTLWHHRTVRNCIQSASCYLMGGAFIASRFVWSYSKIRSVALCSVGLCAGGIYLYARWSSCGLVRQQQNIDAMEPLEQAIKLLEETGKKQVGEAQFLLQEINRQVLPRIQLLAQGVAGDADDLVAALGTFYDVGQRTQQRFDYNQGAVQVLLLSMLSRSDKQSKSPGATQQLLQQISQGGRTGQLLPELPLLRTSPPLTRMQIGADRGHPHGPSRRPVGVPRIS